MGFEPTLEGFLVVGVRIELTPLTTWDKTLSIYANRRSPLPLPVGLRGHGRDRAEVKREKKTKTGGVIFPISIIII